MERFSWIVCRVFMAPTSQPWPQGITAGHLFDTRMASTGLAWRASVVRHCYVFSTCLLWQILSATRKSVNRPGRPSDLGHCCGVFTGDGPQGCLPVSRWDLCWPRSTLHARLAPCLTVGRGQQSRRLPCCLHVLLQLAMWGGDNVDHLTSSLQTLVLLELFNDTSLV